MELKRAYEIVLELAAENALDEAEARLSDLLDHRDEQEEAFKVLGEFMKKHFPQTKCRGWRRYLKPPRFLKRGG